MRKLLDRIFSNRKAAIIVPLVTAAVMYLLFVLFGQGADKMELLLVVPFVSVFWYGGVYFIFWIQTKNPACLEWFFDFAELMALVVFGLGSVSFGLQFLVNMANNFVFSLCPGIITWSAIALVHGKRK